MQEKYWKTVVGAKAFEPLRALFPILSSMSGLLCMYVHIVHVQYAIHCCKYGSEKYWQSVRINGTAFFLLLFCLLHFPYLILYFSFTYIHSVYRLLFLCTFYVYLVGNVNSICLLTSFGKQQSQRIEYTIMLSFCRKLQIRCKCRILSSIFFFCIVDELLCNFVVNFFLIIFRP